MRRIRCSKLKNQHCYITFGVVALRFTVDNYGHVETFSQPNNTISGQAQRFTTVASNLQLSFLNLERDGEGKREYHRTDFMINFCVSMWPDWVSNPVPIWLFRQTGYRLRYAALLTY